MLNDACLHRAPDIEYLPMKFLWNIRKSPLFFNKWPLFTIKVEIELLGSNVEWFHFYTHCWYLHTLYRLCLEVQRKSPDTYSGDWERIAEGYVTRLLIRSVIFRGKRCNRFGFTLNSSYWTKVTPGIFVANSLY